MRTETLIPNRPGSGRAVLLIDDDPVQLKLVRLQLEAAGFVVATASNASSAFEELARRKPDAVVSDVIMDGVDGFALCQSLRGRPELADVPVVLVSSHFDEVDDSALARSVGASALVQRSPTMQPAIDAVVSCLANGAPPQPTSPPPTSELHRSRLAHQLARLSRETSAAEARYRELLERIPEVVWSARADGALTFVSRNVAQFCGFTASEVLAGARGPRWEQVHEDDLPRLHAGFRAALVDDAPIDVELRLRHHDGRWIWIRCRGAASRDDDGMPRLDGVFADITEQKLLEAQVRQSQKLEVVGQLTAGIAHEFNNLCAVIHMSAAMLAESVSETDPHRPDVDDIVHATDRAIALTKQLLAFSRPQTSAHTVDVNATVRGVEHFLRRLIGRDIGVQVSTAPDVGVVTAEPGHLEQVLMNLALNARDAMPDGGSLSVETSAIELDEVSAKAVGVPAPGRYAVVGVKDSGCGMTPETLARIFEPFFTTKSEGRGTGLGLSTSYGIARQSGGTLRAESQPGKGALFQLLLPATAPSDVS